MGGVRPYIFRGLKQVPTLHADAAEGPRGIEAFQAALQLATQRGRKHRDVVSGESISLEVLILEGAETLGPRWESNDEKEDLDLRQAGKKHGWTKIHIGDHENDCVCGTCFPSDHDSGTGFESLAGKQLCMSPLSPDRENGKTWLIPLKVSRSLLKTLIKFVLIQSSVFGFQIITQIY